MEILPLHKGNPTELAFRHHVVPGLHYSHVTRLLRQLVDLAGAFSGHDNAPAVLDIVRRRHFRVDVLAGLEGLRRQRALTRAAHGQGDGFHVRISEYIFVLRVGGYARRYH